MAWHHEIKTVPEEISGGKGSDETMEEARRETERVRRARRRDRQRANRRRPGRPAKAGVGALGVDGVLEIIRKWDAAMEEHQAALVKIVECQDTLGGQMTEIALAIEPILRKIAVVEAGLRGVREVQVADASQADDISAHLFRVEGLVEKTCRGLESEQMARARMEGEVAKLQAGAADAAGRLDATEREVGELRARVEESRVALLGQERLEQERFAEFRETMEQTADGRVEMLEDDLDCLRAAVQDVVDDGERLGKKVGAQGDLLKQAVNNAN